MSFRIFIILFLFPVACYSQGEDHLVPEDSVYADQTSIDYDILVGRVFGEYIPYTYLKMIATPTARMNMQFLLIRKLMSATYHILNQNIIFGIMNY
jgi:hypothetical protein